MEWQTVAIFAGMAVLAIMLVISMLARLYRKVGPNEALLVYGRGKTPRVVKGAGTVIWPLIESCRLLSLELMSFDVAPQQDLYTNQGVAVTVEAVVRMPRSTVSSVGMPLSTSSFTRLRMKTW